MMVNDVMKFSVFAMFVMAMTTVVSAQSIDAIELIEDVEADAEVINSDEIELNAQSATIPTLIELAIRLKIVEAEKKLVEAANEVAELQLEKLRLEEEQRALGYGGNSFSFDQRNQAPTVQHFVRNQEEVSLQSLLNDDVTEEVIEEPQINVLLSKITVSLWNRTANPAKAVISSVEPYIVNQEVTGTAELSSGFTVRVSKENIIASYDGKSFIVASAN